MWNIVIGIVFIVGGLSGKLALIGTGSGPALAVADLGHRADDARQEGANGPVIKPGRPAWAGAAATPRCRLYQAAAEAPASSPARSAQICAPQAHWSRYQHWM